MVKSIIVGNLKKVKKAVPKIEKRTSIKFSFTRGGVVIKGKEYEEFIVETIVRAIDFGFLDEDAFLLFDSDFVLEFIDVKSLTRRKNIKDVRARVIGTGGKALATIENLTGSVIVLQSNTLGVIVDSDHLDSTVQAIESLVRGAKHGNVFAYLEKQNVLRKKIDVDDLGLKEGAKKLGVEEGIVEDFSDDIDDLGLKDG
jgi:ribosomal RNA assembly protein